MIQKYSRALTSTQTQKEQLQLINVSGFCNILQRYHRTVPGTVYRTFTGTFTGTGTGTGRSVQNITESRHNTVTLRR